MLFPTSNALSPAELDLAELTLLRWQAGQEPTATISTIDDGGGSLELGAVDDGTSVRLAVELRSPTQSLVGYGRSSEFVTADLSGVTNVPINIRRPFVYLAGDSSGQVTAIDATRDPLLTQSGGSYIHQIGVMGQPRVVVPTYDGAHLMVVSDTSNGGSAVFLQSTSDHQTVELQPIQLSRPAREAAVSSHGRYIAVAHAGADGGVSMIDMQAEGGPAVNFVSLGAVGAVALAANGIEGEETRVFALLDRPWGLDCTGQPNSRIVELSMEEPAAGGRAILFDGPAHDIAASQNGDFLVLADSCRNRLVRIDISNETNAMSTMAELSRVSSVAVWGQRVWGVGSVPVQQSATGGAFLRLLSMGLYDDQVPSDGTTRTSEPPRFIDLPPLQEEIMTPTFSGSGEIALRQLDADEIYAIDMAVSPSANTVALLFQGQFIASDQGELVGLPGIPVLPGVEMTTYEYLLVDTSNNVAIQRVRTKCEFAPTSDNALVLDWACALASDQDEIAGSYEPTTIAVLYGSR